MLCSGFSGETLGPHTCPIFTELASVFLDPLPVWLPSDITQQCSCGDSVLHKATLRLRSFCSAWGSAGPTSFPGARRLDCVPSGRHQLPPWAARLHYLSGMLCWGGKASGGRHFQQKGRWRHSAVQARSPSPSDSDCPGPIAKQQEVTAQEF